MKTVTLILQELFLLVGTRALRGVGIGLIVARKLTHRERETAGMVLVGVGLLTTIPLAFRSFGKEQSGLICCNFWRGTGAAKSMSAS